MLSLLFAASLAVAQAPDSAHVVLVATTDVHGRATAWDYLADREAPGGLTRVATVVDSLRRRYPGQVVVLDAGDLLQGNPFASYAARPDRDGSNPIIDAMNLVGYDVVTPGNHDFDWGVPELERALADAAFPYVSANIFLVVRDSLLVRPYRVLRRGPVRVAVTGFTTPGAMVWDREQLRGRLRVGRIEASARATFDAMRRTSELVVALSHSGIAGGSTYDTTGVGAEHAAGSFATLRARPDVVIVGHSHGEIRDSVIGGVHFVQPRPYAAGVVVVHVDLARPEDGAWAIKGIRSDLVTTRDVPPVRAAGAAAPARARLGARLAEGAGGERRRADAGGGGAGGSDAPARLDARDVPPPRGSAALRGAGLRSRRGPAGGHHPSPGHPPPLSLREHAPHHSRHRRAASRVPGA